MANYSTDEVTSRIEGTLFSVVSATASVVGSDYFSATVEHLADALEASSAFICEFSEDGQRLGAVACWPKPSEPTAISFPTFDSAGGSTRTGVPATHPNKVRQLFPEDHLVDFLSLNSFAAVPMYASTGKPNGFLGIGDERRLTTALPTEAVMRLVAARAGAEVERLQGDRLIRKQGELLRMFSERTADIILRYRLLPTPLVEYVSPAFERVTGYACDELYANPGLLTRMVHPEDRAEFQDVLAGNQDLTQMWRFLKKSGEIFWIDGRRTAIRNEVGQVIAYETVARDVTIQRTAQIAAEKLAAQQQFLLDAIPDTIAHIGRDGRILDYRPSGSHPPFLTDEPIGRHVSELFPFDFVSVALSRLSSVFETQSTETLRYRTSGGHEDHIFEARLAPTGTDQVVMLIRDITAADWMMKEETRRQMRAALEVSAEHHLDSENPYALTVREFTVLALMARGDGDKQIANELGISAYTVNKHVSNILGKMSVSSRTEASVRALQEGLLPAFEP